MSYLEKVVFQVFRLEIHTNSHTNIDITFYEERDEL